MDDFGLLVLLSSAMFVGSYLAGILPLVLPFSEAKLRIVTVAGAGLLVGTALAVIIPEGVQSIYSAQSEINAISHIRQVSQQNTVAAAVHSKKPESFKNLDQAAKVIQRVEKDTGSGITLNTNSNDALSLNFEKNSKIGDNKVNDASEQLEQKSRRQKRHAVDSQHANEMEVETDQSHHDASKDVDVHSDVGLALVAGFVLMLLVDQLAQRRGFSSASIESGVIVQQARYKITATIGLVVHAAADGVALGAASGSSHNDVQFIVFLAIMLHKAPAAFGLVTFLLHEGLDKSRIRRHLLVFALAAPLAAIVTFLFVTQGGPESLTSMHSTGVLLLFSAGTFLYVATVHVLPEIAAHSGDGLGHHNGASTSAGGLNCGELLALVAGAVLPTFLTVGHSH